MYDWIVIGGGSAGVRFSRRMGGLGYKVLLIENQHIGGTCVNKGCVPKKLYVYGSNAQHNLDHISDYGIKLSSYSLDFKNYAQRVFQHIEKIKRSYGSMLENAGVQVMQGSASFVDAHTVLLDGTYIEAKNILIATGARPFLSSTIEGADLAYTSDDVFQLRTLPKTMLVVGGGYIGIELYSIFKNWNVDVTLSIRQDYVLKNTFDVDIRKILTTWLEQDKPFVRGSPVKIEKDHQQFIVTYKDGQKIQTDFPLLALGRVGEIEHLNYQKLNLTLTSDHRFIQVNPKTYQTNVSSVYAIGDVIGTMQLTPVALEQAERLVDQQGHKLNNALPIPYHHVPTAIFTSPPVASVGLTEEDAVNVHKDIDVYTSQFTPLEFVMETNPPKTYIKVITEIIDQRVIGIHMFGYGAAEVIQGFAFAVSKGLRIQELHRFIGIHPSTAEEFFSLRDPKEIRTSNKG